MSASPARNGTSASNARMMEAGTVVAGKFVVEKTLGAGGMGVVFKARHRDLGNYVAIKMLQRAFCEDAEMTERFKREALAMANLKSPHGIRVFDVGQTNDGVPFIVMEYLDGKDLATVLKEDGPVNVDRALAWMIDVCDALIEAHDAGIVHRDLKPQNIFIERRGKGDHVRVLDFGLAKAFGSGSANLGWNQLTATGMVLGTTHYMAPEQIRNAPLDGRTDVWAVGATLFRLLTRHYPFERDNPAAECAAILATPSAEMRSYRPDIPFQVEALVARCLAKNMNDRPANTRALLADLENTRNDIVSASGHRSRPANQFGGPVIGHSLSAATMVSQPTPHAFPARRPSPPPPAAPRTSRAAIIALVGVWTAVVLALCVLVIYVKRSRDHRAETAQTTSAVVAASAPPQPAAPAPSSPPVTAEPAPSASMASPALAGAAVPSARPAGAAPPLPGVAAAPPTSARSRPTQAPAAGPTPRAAPSSQSGDLYDHL